MNEVLKFVSTMNVCLNPYEHVNGNVNHEKQKQLIIFH